MSGFNPDNLDSIAAYNWQREKQGLPPLTPGEIQALNWQREKQGLPPLTDASGPQAWQREKQGNPLPAAQAGPPPNSSLVSGPPARDDHAPWRPPAANAVPPTNRVNPTNVNGPAVPTNRMGVSSLNNPAIPTHRVNQPELDPPTAPIDPDDLMPTREIDPNSPDMPTARVDPNDLAALDDVATYNLGQNQAARNWQREKQGLPPLPDTQDLDALNWQREKQGLPPLTSQSSLDEQNWQREKQGLPPLPASNTPQTLEELNWQREKQGQTAMTPTQYQEELNWQREKQGLPPVNPNSASLDEQNWQREKQGLPPLAPNSPSAEELNWQREKQGLPPLPANSASIEEQNWQREKQGLPPLSGQPSAEELNWQREKQGLPPLPANAFNSQEVNWQREKQGLPPVADSGYSSIEEQNWQREKQGLPPVAPVSRANEMNWQREKQGLPPLLPDTRGDSGSSQPIYVSRYQPDPVTGAKPKKPRRRNRGVWLLLAGLLLLLAAAGIIVYAVAFAPKEGESTNNPPVLPVVPGENTPIPGLDPAQITANAGKRTPTAVPVSQSEAQKVFEQGKTAYDAKKWEEAIANFERFKPSDTLYVSVLPLLTNSYIQYGDQLVAQTGGNKLGTAQDALRLYDKAQKLNPNYPDIGVTANRARLYVEGRTKYEAGKFDEAIKPLDALYNTPFKDNSRFRDVADLYYDSLIQLGTSQESQNDLQTALENYRLAASLEVADKKTAEGKIAAIEEKLKPTATPTPTATPSPIATATPRPTATPKPTATPEPPTAVPVPPTPTTGCIQANYFAYRSSPAPALNVPDEGSSSISGAVIDRNGAGIAGATVRVSSGGYSFSARTNGSGRYAIGGLGRGTWDVVVVASPNRCINGSFSVAVTVTGGKNYGGYADFTESAP